MNVKRDLPPVDERLTIGEVEKLTGLTRGTIRYQLRHGNFPRPIHRVGHFPVFVKGEITGYMERCQRELAKKFRTSVRDAAYSGGDE